MSSTFSNFGLSNLDFIYNLGLDFYCLLFYFVGLALLLLSYPLVRIKYVRFTFHYLFEKFIHSYILRLLLESFIINSFCSIISVYELVYYTKLSNLLSTVVAVLVLAINLFLPLIILIILKRNYGS